MTRLGLVVSRTSVHAVVMDGGTPVWMAERTIGDVAELRDVVLTLAREAPPSPRMIVALHRDVCQVRSLHDVPRLSSERLARAVALEPYRWFLRNGHPLVTGAWWVGRGQAVAAAADGAVIRVLTDAAASAGLHLDGFVPVAMVAEDNEDGVDPSATARAVAEHVPRWQLDPPGDAAKRRARRRRNAFRLTMSAAVLWITAAAIGWWRVDATVAGAGRALDSLGVLVAPALVVEREARVLEEAVETLAAAARARSRVVPLLEALAEVLPADVRVLSVQVEPGGQATLTGTGPSTGVTAALGRVPGVRDVTLTGGGEQFVIRFGWGDR